MSGESSNNAPTVAPDAVQNPADIKDDAPASPPAAEAAAPADDKPAAVADVPEAGAAATSEKESSAKPGPAPADKVSDSPAEKPDVEMADAAAAPSETPAADAEGAAAAAAPPSAAAPTPSKAKAKRKSVGAADTKGKKLNRKQSKARITHLDAHPGDHYFVKLKGFPQWPVIICDEDMLPQLLLKSRPVTAKRADGTYREDYADGSKKAGDRTFPVMYLHTNEFGWIPNTDLIELDPATVKDLKSDKMRKDLQAAHDLAAEQHPLSYYKEVLHRFQEDLIEQEKHKAAKAATPKSKKAKAATTDDEAEDVEMADAADEDEESKDKKAKKRKAEENAETPQRSDSVKKPKIKLTTNSTPKTNGATPSAKPAKLATEAKPAKSKTKKPKESEEKEKEPVTPKEPEISPEERHQRKEKEVLFCRHKLQKGLLTRDQEPKEEEMKSMSEYISKLELMPDLEVSIIRTTKINKVLKAILKLNNIPKDDELKFKPRSQALLDTWNKLLAVDETPADGANGVKTKDVPKTNGLKAKSETAEPEKPKEEAKEAAEEEAKDADKAEKSASPAKPTEETKAPEAVEASA